MKQRGAAFVVAIALLTMTGCTTSLGDFVTTPPSGADQQIALALAMKGAQLGCQRLARAIRPGEAADAAKSLDYVSQLLAKNPSIDATQLTADLARAQPDVAMFAPEIIFAASMASQQIPDDQRDALYFLAVQAVVTQCRLVLGGSGTACLGPLAVYAST